MSAADRDEPLGIDDLECLAAVAHLTGSDDCADLWIRAHHDCLRRGDLARAARCAFWLARGLLEAGETARGGGWLAMAQRLLDESGLEWLGSPELIGPLLPRPFLQSEVLGSGVLHDDVRVQPPAVRLVGDRPAARWTTIALPESGHALISVTAGPRRCLLACSLVFLVPASGRFGR